MNKNSIMAVILSGLVLFAFMLMQTRNAQKAALSNNEEQTTEAVENSTDENVSVTESNAEISVADEENEIVEEEHYVVETNKVRITFTNRGGDVTGIELLDHKDTRAGKLVQLAENVSEKNRAFSLTLGENNKIPVNDIFIAKEVPADEKGQKKIIFAKKYSNYTLIKQYTFTPDDYMFKLNVMIDGAEGFNGLSFGSDENKVAYTLRTSPQIGPEYDAKKDRYENRTFLGHNGSKVKRIALSEKQYKKYGKEISWAGIAGKYFCELVVPENSLSVKDVWYSTNKGNFAMANAQIFIERKPVDEKRVNDTYYIYAGPRSEKELKKFTSASSNGWGFEGKKINDALQTSSFLGWLEIAFKWMMQVIYNVVKNWGVSIIIMTVILKIVLFPLTLKSSIGTLKMQELQPKIQSIQTRYKDNPQKLQAETAKLYQEAGYNPMSGCLPMIFQMMALIAMYNLFNNYFEFRGAGFVPGWIDDLSIGDSIWSWKKDIPFITGFTGNSLRILPIIYLISQLFYGKITSVGGTANAGQNAQSLKFMMYGLPVIFFFMFYNAPAGLILFWTVSNVIQMVQQVIINQIMAKKKAEGTVKSGNPNVKQFPSKKGKKK